MDELTGSLLLRPSVLLSRKVNVPKPEPPLPEEPFSARLAVNYQ